MAERSGIGLTVLRKARRRLDKAIHIWREIYKRASVVCAEEVDQVILLVKQARSILETA